MLRKVLSFLVLMILITSGCAQTTPSAGVESPPEDNNHPQESRDKDYPLSPSDYLDNFLLKIGEATRETISYKDVASVTVLVNKQNELPADYVPPDLVYVDIPFTFSEKVEKRMMRQEAAGKLEELFAAAKEKNIILYGVSGYRSYQTQKSLFAYFTQRDGSEEKANQISARPGESEHQTGLAMDVSSQSVNFGLVENFGDTEEYAWLKDHAHEYGFIIRYPKGKEHITEYSYEPWHLRYVGIELATKLYEENLTYEEYLFFKI
ncbi:MAG: M15 family metallopeptidase [Desulfitobacteriia bacterium]|jgi:D-alanyl-D-alanine carboxypeptidase